MLAMNQQSIKYNNIKRIYTLISRGQANSRAELAKVTRLSKTTVSALVEELIKSGYIAECGSDTATSPGRKRSLLEINSSANFVAVVAWHHSRLIGALVNTATQVVAWEERSMPEGGDYVERTVSLLNDAIFPATEGKRVLGVCVVVPSMVNDQRRQIISTVLGLDEKSDVVRRLREALPGYPLAILNDTACYAYAEYIASGIQEKEYVFVNVGKGVGAVLLSGGVMMRGANGMTTQFGHSSIDRNGPLCECGNRGCLEHMIGEGALERLAEEYGLRDQLPRTRKIQFRDVGALATGGNRSARTLVERMASDLAYGLSNLIALIHPQIIVIGGFGINLGELYLNRVRESLKTMGFPPFVQDTEVRFAQGDERAELPGAAGYYLDIHYQFDGSMGEKLILS